MEGASRGYYGDSTVGDKSAKSLPENARAQLGAYITLYDSTMTVIKNINANVDGVKSGG